MAEASETPPEKTLFSKIIDGVLPGELVYEDDLVVAFPDINPAAPVHLLVVPRKPIPSLADATDADEPALGRLLTVARRLAAERGLDGGYRVIMNCGDDGGQVVPHVHLHLLGGQKLGTAIL